MRKRRWSTAATLVVLLSGAGVLLGGPRVLAADGRVAMVDADSDAMKWRFEPAEVTVPVGSAVVWHNDGKQAHTATADDNSFDSSYVNGGGDFQWKFSAPGNFAYHCTPHPWMKGVVHVVGASTPTPAAPPTTAPPASSGTPATTAAAPDARTGAAQASTTTTKASAGAATATTTAPAAAASAPATTTTLAAATTPTSAPDSAGVTTTTSGPMIDEEAVAGKSSGSSDEKKTNVLGVALAGILTLGLGGISAKLLTAKP